MAARGDAVAPLSLSSGYLWSQLRSNQRPPVDSDNQPGFGTICRQDDGTKEVDGGRLVKFVRMFDFSQSEFG